MKALMAQDMLCAYPNHNKEFHIHMDASDYQMSSCIMPEGKPVAYWSNKLIGAQMNYLMIDEELLSIVMTLCEFQSMLLSTELHLCTDHRNILILGNSLHRWLWWISYIDEYMNTDQHYIVLKALKT